VAATFRSDPQTAFLSLNVDEDRGGVAAFLKFQGWSVPVAYALGLDQLLKVSAIPTLVIFDRKGQVVYRENGVNLGSFVEDLKKHLREAQRAAADNRQ
jgi:hypothetical protein